MKWCQKPILTPMDNIVVVQVLQPEEDLPCVLLYDLPHRPSNVTATIDPGTKAQQCTAETKTIARRREAW